MLFVGYNSKIDWDTSISFTSICSMYLDNYYQYINPVYDNIYWYYTTETNQLTQRDYAKQLQAILYEDLPATTIIYPRDLHGFNDNLTGIDPFLYGNAIGRYEYWDDPIDHIMKYAIPAQLFEPNAFVQTSNYDGLWMQGVYGSLYQRAQLSRLWEPQIATAEPILVIMVRILQLISIL